MSLTRYKEGSVGELWTLAYPLIISFFATFLMTFVDRLYLAQYSGIALNSATNAMAYSWAPTYGFMTLASISEVFVAQNNGARFYKRLGEPVWQMIWLALGSFAFFIPMGYWGTGLIYGDTLPMAQDYFSITMYFGPVMVAIYAITGFYIGRGKTRVITWLAIGGNVVNAILDPILIFGWGNICPEMGTKGAAIATGFGVTFQVGILLYLFLRRKNRIDFGTGNWRFIPEMFLKCVRVGLPSALFFTFELLGWSSCYYLLSKTSEGHMLISSICQSILFPFLCIGFAMDKAGASVSGNLIGARKQSCMNKALRSGIILCLLLSALTWVLMVGFPDFLLNMLMSNPDILSTIDVSAVASTDNPYEEIRSLVGIGLIYLAAYITIENIRWFIGGLLIGAGDTTFLMISGFVSTWLFLVLPNYIFLTVMDGSMEYVYFSWILFAGTALLFVAVRYWQGGWRKLKLIET